MTDAAVAVAGPRFQLLASSRPEARFADDVRIGLTSHPKTLPPRWFYDELGSALFDAICLLPGYYVTRAEAEILVRYGKEIAAAFGEVSRLIELGSGTARKTRLLLDELTGDGRSLEYVPLDVDGGMLERSGMELLGEYALLRVTAIHGDLAAPAAALSQLGPSRGRTAVLFLGSTIGNLEPEAAAAMLISLRTLLRRGDALLLGADLVKPLPLLEAAYDDPIGLTAAFNLNLLQRINRELGGEFDLRSFRHRAIYDENRQRIEMHLVSERAQKVTIGALGLEIDFEAGETIHTENSCKYDDSSLAQLAKAGGFHIEKVWNDANGWFASVLLRVP